MAQTQSAQGPSEPDANGTSGMSESPDLWGNGGLVGDGRYRLTGRLGRGGMAEVFAAEDVRLGRTVAVKLLRADLAEDPVSKARFTREAQSVAGLNHHAVVAVYDSGEDVVGQQTVPYIVMELVEGHTIRDLLLNADAPPPDQALIIVSGVLEALAYSHQHGIVHRDIKPANVIITNSGAVKVMDFGIARALHGASTTMTQTGMVMGTPQYLSPEQALGKAVDHRSDLYATGCLLYELLAQRPPFVGETPLSVVYQHVQDIPVPPSEVSGGAVPPELDGMVMRALAKDPDDRFQSAEEMRGLVQYALQMLQEAGGHTGTWNTGPVTQHLGASTPAMGMPSTTALPHPAHGDTSQQPLLTGGYRDDDGGFDGGSRPSGGGGRRRVWLLAVLAVIAIAAGVAFAMKLSGNDKETPTRPKQSQSSSKDPKSKEPSKKPTSAPPDTSIPGGGDVPDDNTGAPQTGGNGGNWPTGNRPTNTYSPGPTDVPSGEPSGGVTTAPTDPPSDPVTTPPATTDPTGDDSGGGGETPTDPEPPTGGGEDPVEG
ncbi:protein kinase domain-containing protein [Streptomyces sp. SAJ15]|uniref:protein kinase domain-containing protein n=1 Tax=Streptomyces sp. SAJ15 TaxID=2011095 RepID=UPI0011855F48|nr:protein kinase [Streptomyces sp. SAJ15]TVL92447.1 serine/threonine protein kinase [Streptomyces sp. SAJ15]